MTTHKRNAIGLHYESQASQARAAFITIRGEAAALERDRVIAALPVVQFKGRRLYAIRCRGLTGRGPHAVNVPPSLLWSLIDVRDYRCPFHANDWSERQGEKVKRMSVKPADVMDWAVAIAFSALVVGLSASFVLWLLFA